MTARDIDTVVEIAGSLKDAPRWPREAYWSAIDPGALPARVALVAESAGGAVVGFAVALVLPPEAELESIAVHAAVQRRGVARKLLQRLVTELASCGATELRLEVRASNHAALAFYRGVGFVELGHRPAYYSAPVENAVLMSRILGQG